MLTNTNTVMKHQLKNISSGNHTNNKPFYLGNRTKYDDIAEPKKNVQSSV